MNFTTMRPRPGSVYNFDELYVAGVDIFELIRQSQNNQAPYAPSLVVATEQYVVARAGVGYDAGDVLYNSIFVDATVSPVTVSETWVNYTKKTRLVPDPVLSDLNLTQSGGTSSNQTTQFSVFTGATQATSGFSGLVPPPNQGDNTRFLSGSGTWLDLPSYIFNSFTGATANLDGAVGAVPAPGKGDEDKFLKGDGTWATILAETTGTPLNVSIYVGNTATNNGISGLVPSADAGVQNLFLRNDGIWATIPQFSAFTGTTGTASGALGLVPAPQTADAGKYLRADGTWQTVSGTASPLFVGTVGFADGVRGLVPGPLMTDAGKYLRADGAWVIPSFNLISMTGANSTADGGAGAVPAPLKADRVKFLRGDGTWASAPVYVPAVFTGTNGTVGGSAGLVPAPETTDVNQYLKADGSWSSVPIYVPAVFTGTGGVTAGTSGLVPSPQTTDAGKYLRADGSWGLPSVSASTMVGATVSVNGIAGIVPAPLKTDSTNFLRGDGTWAAVPVGTGTGTSVTYSAFTGATISLNGASGLVPAPQAADSVKYLRGDGTWAAINVTNTTTTNTINNTISVSNYSSAVSYAAGIIVRYTDGYWYVSNGTIAAGTLWVIGTSGATWTMITSAVPLLTGLLLNSSAPVVATDTYLIAVGKLQAQVTAIPSNDTTYTGKQSFLGDGTKFGAFLSSAVEKINIVNTGAAGSLNFDIASGAILYFLPDATANWSVNFRMSSTTSLNTAMDIGQSCTVAMMVSQGATPYYATVFGVDGANVTPKWADGTPPTAGNASSLDSYSFSIIKTGNAAFTILASLASFK
jgi:hypothetical protein